VSWTWRGRCIPSNYAWCSMIFRWINRVSPILGLWKWERTEPWARPQQLQPPTPFAGASSGRRRGGGRFSHRMSGGSWIAGPQNHSSSRSVLRKTNGLFVPQLWETLAVFVQKCW
jgi:hypothetical protein